MSEGPLLACFCVTGVGEGFEISGGGGLGGGGLGGGGLGGRAARSRWLGCSGRGTRRGPCFKSFTIPRLVAFGATISTISTHGFVFIDRK